jgi:hypothetical protein
MQYTKFVVKVTRAGVTGDEYVQRIDRKPIQITFERNQALQMGKLTAMEVLDSLQKKWSPEMIAIHVTK